MADEQGKRRSRGKKRAPAHFKANSSLVQNLLTGAEDVASRSFLGGGGVSPKLPEVTTSQSGESSQENSLPATATEAETPTSARVASQPTASPEPAPEATPEPKSEPEPTAQPTPEAAPQPEPAPEPKPEATPQPTPEPKPEADKAGTSRSRRARTRVWAHKAVHESYADAKLRSSTWRAHGFRIAPDVLHRLKERLNADRRTTGNPGLAIGHYVDAALRHAPPSVEEQIEMAAAFSESQLWDKEKTQPSTYRIGRQAHEFASTLKLNLQEADFGRRGTQVMSAVIERFLDALNAEGPLQRPARRRPER